MQINGVTPTDADQMLIFNNICPKKLQVLAVTTNFARPAPGGNF